MTVPFSGAGLPGTTPGSAVPGAAQPGGPTGPVGVAQFTVTVTDAAGQTASESLSLLIAAGQILGIITRSLPVATIGVPYATQFAAVGGLGPYSWAVTAGSLPAGLALTPTGALAGTPTALGTSSFTVQVTDAASSTATAVLSVTVAPVVLAVTTTALPPATVSVIYTGTLAASGGVPPYTWSLASGALPPGLALGADGTIGGVPDGSGSFGFTVQVTDSLAATATAALVIAVAVAPVIVSPGPWKFLYGPPQPAGGYTDVLAQAQSRQLILRSEAGQNHQASLDIDGRNPQAAAVVELQTDIQVLYGPQIVFCGRVVPTENILDASAGTHRRVITALDYREVLRRRMILGSDQVSWTNVEQATIAWQLIQHAQAHPGGKLGIAQGKGTSTGTQRTMTFAVSDFVGADIDTMAQLANGFEWQITPYGPSDLRLDIFAPQMGADNGRVLVWGDPRIASIDRQVDPTTFGNAVYVTGDASVTLTPQQLDATDIATRPEGRWDSLAGTTLLTQSSLNDDAAQELANAEVLTPSYTVVLVRGTWDGPSDIWIGDTVTLVIDDGALQVNDKLRVVEMQFDIDSDGVETTTLTIGAIPLRPYKLLSDVMRQLRFLATR